MLFALIKEEPVSHIPACFQIEIKSRLFLMKANMVKRILIVDDDQLILYAISKAICRDGVEIDMVSTGKEAIVRIKACLYDLGFLDICLPDINGLDIVNMLKEISPKTKVAVMTASHVEDNMRRAIDDIADYFIAKPFDLYQIRRIAWSALEEGDVDKNHKLYEEEFVKDRRRFKRSRLLKTIEFSVTVLEFGKFKNLNLTGDIIDTSDAGMGIRTGYALEPGHIVRLGKGAEHEAGIVRWSMIGGNTDNYWVGIQFIQT